ncbi:MAG: hypothetical protein LBI36_01030 [Oscillospiraceae bacterium]|nr:hypothetical protein [Oscillospiraceae bacterium]
MKKFKAALSAFIAVVITVTVVPAGFAEIKSKAAAKLSFEEYLATELVKFPEKITIPSEYLSKTYETKKDLDNIKKESSALIEKCGAAIQDNPELFFVDKFTPNSVRVSYDYIGYNDGTIGDFTFTYTVSYLGKDGKSANAKAAKSAYADMKKKFDAEVKKALEAVRAAEEEQRSGAEHV